MSMCEEMKRFWKILSFLKRIGHLFFSNYFFKLKDDVFDYLTN